MFCAACLHYWVTMRPVRHTEKFHRAGRATSLAASGHSIGEILIAGEWKPSAFPKYCRADDLSASALLNVVLENDLEHDSFGIDGDLWHAS